MEVGSLLFNTQFTLGRIPHVLRLKSLEGKVLKPKFQVSFANEFYEVKTINHFDELLQVLKLRFEVFFREFSSQKVTFSLFPYDIDLYDFLCDHLVVKDKATNQVIACYRLLQLESGSTQRFYSQGEFDLSSLLIKEGKKLELGRACVHKDYRRGAVISLLWKGLLDYARKSNTRYMFGCSSIPRKDFGNLHSINEILESQKCFIEDLEVSVQAKFQLKIKIEPAVEPSAKPIGSLMNMYLLAGAKLGRNVAYDSEMDCLDMFTLMDLTQMPVSFERRFS